MHTRLIYLLSCLTAVMPAVAAVDPDPVFDHAAIVRDPLDAQLISRTKDNGLIIEEIEYTSEVVDDQPIRMRGILAYPAGGSDLPSIFWSQPGMAPASDYWPRLWAAKGYVCLNITLPHGLFEASARFTTEQPSRGNLARMAHAQMRGITYLSQRPEVDAERMGIGGSSYGGLFASLIAGADPRIQCGMSFFVTGNHRLGSNFPQFTALGTMQAVDIWDRTIDSAWRLRHRAVPFLFAVASNDPWLHMPAAVESYAGSIGEKRLTIAPNWSHGFPDNVDQMLIDWFDVYLKEDRAPYNQPSALELSVEDDHLTAQWQWEGANPVAKAELIVAYGRTRPWHDGWPHRYHHIITADINGKSASAVIPRPDQAIEGLVYGNITDDRGVLVSTLPVTIDAATWQNVPITPLTLNVARISDFSPDELDFFARHGQRVHGEPDPATHHSGTQSLRVRTPDGAQPRPVNIQLGHIPERSHRLTLWLKAEQETEINVSVTAIPPANLNSPVVQQLRQHYAGDSAPATVPGQPPVFNIRAVIGTNWQPLTLDCPFNGESLSGYQLRIVEFNGITYWVDTLAFEPLFEEDR